MIYEKSEKKTYGIHVTVIDFLLSGCVEKTDHSVNKNDDFIIKLYTDKEKYNDGEEIGCYATVQYTGGADDITIFVDVPSVLFAIKSSSGDGIGGMSLLMLVDEEFKKDETKTYGFQNKRQSRY